MAGTGPGGIDSGGFSGDGGQATSARLFAPMDVAIDATGNLYIADQRNRRVRKISHDGTIRTIAGTGQLGKQRRWWACALGHILKIPRELRLIAMATFLLLPAVFRPSFGY